jgi:hypothetical protein
MMTRKEMRCKMPRTEMLERLHLDDDDEDNIDPSDNLVYLDNFDSDDETYDPDNPNNDDYFYYM